MLMNPRADAATPDIAAMVDGRPSESQSTATVDVINPSSGRRCISIPVGCDADVDCAVAAARRAFDDGRWSMAAPSARKKVLHELANLIERHAAELDALDAAEMGKPVSEAFGSAKVAAGLMRFHAEAVDKMLGDVYGSDRNSFVAQRWVARGVVAAIVPWNFPAYVTVLKAAPALAAGNCVVLKPSEMSSRSALRIAQLALQAELPPGAFNVVPGLGGTVGRALGLHMDVDMVTFTGSTDVGRLMLQYAGQSNMKVVMAECGGKSPQIVFDDGVDLDAAADTIARTLLTNQGQICSVGTRLLVQRSVEHAMIERIAARFQRIVMGDASDPATTFGPLASAKQCERVMRYIDGAATEGAQLVAGGRRALQERGGYFVEPTLFRSVSPVARIAREEIFGPVLAVMSFQDAAEAIRIANSTAYGLAAYVWTADLSTGMQMMKGIRSTLWVNATAPAGEGAGFVGSSEPVGMSGVGTECGLAGIQSYMRRQRVTFNHA
jgi:acyl-CoA reductase-like NAD-dependent aldehyde dehydrogenase